MQSSQRSTSDATNPSISFTRAGSAPSSYILLSSVRKRFMLTPAKSCSCACRRSRSLLKVPIQSSHIARSVETPIRSLRAKPASFAFRRSKPYACDRRGLILQHQSGSVGSAISALAIAEHLVVHEECGRLAGDLFEIRHDFHRRSFLFHLFRNEPCKHVLGCDIALGARQFHEIVNALRNVALVLVGSLVHVERRIPFVRRLVESAQLDTSAAVHDVA